MRHVSDGELHAFLDGGLDLLPEGRGGEVREHISSCSVCQERLQDEENLRSQAAGILGEPPLDQVSLPTFEELREMAEARVGEEQKGDHGDKKVSRYRGPLKGIPLAWAATIVLALGVGWLGGEFARSTNRALLIRPGLDQSAVPAQSEAGLSDLAVDPSAAAERLGSRGGVQTEPLILEGEGVATPAGLEAAGPARERQEAVPEPPVVNLQAATETLAREEEAHRRVEPTTQTRSDTGPDPAEARMAADEALSLRARLTASEQPARAMAAAARTPEDPEAENPSLPAPVPEAEATDSMTLTSLENSLAVPGLKVVSIGWETRVPGEKSLLIRQLLVAPGDTLELRYFGMLLGVDPLPTAPKETGVPLGEATGGRVQAAVLEATLPAGWSQVVMEWGRVLVVARAPLPEENLKALLKTIH